MTTFDKSHYSHADRRANPAATMTKSAGALQLVTHLTLLLLLVLLVYFGMWRAYFATLDDFGITGWVRSRASLWVAMQGYGSGVRFLNYIPIWFKSQAFGLDAAPYLWSGLAQYIVVVWLIYALARQLFGRAMHGLLAATLFAVIYSHYEVVTYVSASDYTLWASFYLTTVVLFLRFLARRSWRSYWGALVTYSCLAFGHDFALSLPLVLLAFHLLRYWDGAQWWRLGWQERVQQGRQLLRLHLPFWLLWATHVILQLTLVATGTSEAIYSTVGYAPGLHMLTNLRYLIFLLLPNVTTGPIYSFLSAYLSVAGVDALWQLSMLLGVLLHLSLAWLFWRGPAPVRVAIALIYLPFLQYTPWQGHFIEAPRYLLLPSVGWALLLAWSLLSFVSQWRLGPSRRLRSVVAGLLVALFLVANTAVIQIWIRQHIENGHFRRTFVTALHDRYYTELGPDAYVWIEVPEEKYTDLADSCRLVFDQYFVRCLTYVTGGEPPSARSAGIADRDFYWLQATPDGIVQRYPAN